MVSALFRRHSYGKASGVEPVRLLNHILQFYFTFLQEGVHPLLFKPNRPGYLDLAVDKIDIKSTVYGHPEFAAFMARMNTLFDKWRQKKATTLRQLNIGFHPKEVIVAVAEDLFAHYARKPLIDNYDVYQHLMDYWADTMQDDCYLIAADGWKAETSPIMDKKGKEKGWTCDLVPKALIVARYFAKEQEDIDKLAVELESVIARMTELEEEHGGDDGAFPRDEKINKATVTGELRRIKDDKQAKDDVAALHEWLKLAGDETDLKRALKDAEAALDAKAHAKYPKLTEAEVKTLVVDDKWLAMLDTAIHGEMDRISQCLTQRVKELAERYETPMPEQVHAVAELEARVNGHLERMGFSWK